MSIISVKNDALSRESVATSFIPVPPTISGYTVTGTDDLALDPAGGQAIEITGTGFLAGATITINGSVVAAVTYVNSNSLTFTSSAVAAGTYTIYAVNPDGGTAIYIPGLIYSNLPTWVTSAGSLASIYEYSPVSNTVAATGDGSVSYSLYSGTLPPGSTLDSSTGIITGTSPASATATTYTFVIRATDAQLQDSVRTFSITVNTDVVTWSTPANNSTSILTVDEVAATTTLLATSAAGKAITYTANTLPTGLSISGATVIGTPTAIASTASTFTATAADTGKTATRTINWNITVAGDLYFPYTTLLLSGSASTATFVTDASTNNFALTITGDTKPNNFNPYTPGYYSNYFNGSSNFTSSTSQIIPTGSFTVECWVYVTSTSNQVFVAQGTNANAARFCLAIDANLWQTQIGNANINIGTPIINTWNYIAVTFNGSTLTLYVNGTSIGTVSTSTSAQNTTLVIGAIGPSWGTGYSVTGYISNLRVSSVVRTIVTPTAPYTSDASTRLLTCQSNRFLDNSSNAFALTITGTPSVQSSTPFVPNTAYAAYGSTYFDGTGDYLTAPSNAAFQFGTGDFTVEYWINFTTTPGASSIVPLSCWSSNSGWELYYRSVGTVFAWYYNSTFLAGTTVPKPNTWYHLAVTRSSATTRLFVNGAIEATLNSDTTNFTPSSALYIGNENGTSNFFTGYLTDVRVIKGTAVYTSAFTPSTAPLTAITNTSLLTLQTNQPANNSVFLDSSTNAFAITRAGNTTQGTFSPYGANWSNYFDGTGDYMDPVSSSVSLSANWTIELWFNTAAGDGVQIFDSRPDATNGFYPTIGTISATQINTYYNSISYSITVGTYRSVWNHVAMVKNSGTLTIYFNGVSVYSVADSNTWLIGTNRPRLAANGGYFAAGPNYYTGYISNFRIVNGTAVYTTAFTPSTTPLTAITNTRLLTCQSNRFVDNSTNAFAITRYGDTKVQRFSPFSPQTQTAITHSAYFDGNGDYLVTPANAALTFGTGDLTLECWIYQTATSTSTYRVIFTDNVYGNAGGYTLYSYNNALNLWKGGSGGVEVIAPAGTITLNTWTHVAWTRSGSSNRLFINGTQVGSTTTDATNYTSTTSYIGASQTGTLPFAGYISNARIVKGTAVYTTTFTPSTTPLTAISGTSLLTLQSPTFIDNSTNNFTITAVGNSQPRTVNPFGFTSATAAYTAATYGASAYFDGAGDYLTVPSNAAFDFVSGDLTIEAWVYLTTLASSVGTSTYSTIFSTFPASGTITGYAFGVATTGYLIVDTYVSGTSQALTATNNILSANTWYHVAVTRGSGTFRLFVNGIVTTYSGTLSQAVNSGGNTAKIGALLFTTYYDYLTGSISDLRVVKGTAVYTSAFTPPTAPLTAITNTSLLLNYTNAGITDSTMINDLETVGDAKRVSTHTPYAGSYYSNYFDGTGDYLSTTVNLAIATGPFTMEAWVYLTALGTERVIFNNLSWSGGNNGGWYLTTDSTNRVWLRASTNTYNSRTTVILSSSTLAANTWTHVAVVRDSNNLVSMYFNGISAATPVTYAASLNQGTGQLFRIGAWNPDGGSQDFWLGYISNARVVTGAAVYTSTFTPPTTPLTAIANTSLLTCQSNRFLDNSTNAFTITKYGDTAVQSFNPFQRNSATTMSFDGTGDYLSVPYNTAFNFGTASFTIESWVYFTTSGTAQCIVSTYYSGLVSASATGYEFLITSTNFLAFDTFIPNSNQAITATNNALVINSWNHVAIVNNAGTFNLYVNGVQCTKTGTMTQAVNSKSPSSALTVGLSLYSPYNHPTTGYINDLRITNGVARYTATFTPPSLSFLTK